MRTCPGYTSALLDREAMGGSLHSEEEPTSEQPKMAGRGSKIRLDLLGNFKDPVALFPLEGPGAIAEEDLQRLEDAIVFLTKCRRLTKREARVIRQLADGATFSQMAITGGFTKTTAKQIATAAVLKIRRLVPGIHLH